MRSKKHSFSMSFFLAGNRVMFLEYVRDTDRAIKWVNDKNIDWDTVNIYDRISRGLLASVKNDHLFPYSITFVLVVNGARYRQLYLRDVTDVLAAIDWAIKKGISFTYANVYNNITRLFVKRIYL